MGYFYVKAGLGTRTSGGEKTLEGGAFESAGLEAADVYDYIDVALQDAAPPDAGDFICCSNSHAEAHGGAEVLIIPDGVTVISVDDTDADAYATGAYESTVGDLDLLCDTEGGTVTFEGMKYLIGDNLRFGEEGASFILKECTLEFTVASSSNFITTVSSNGDGITVNFHDCIFDPPNTSSGALFNFSQCPTYNVFGGSIALNDNKLGYLAHTSGSGGGTLNVYGTDLSNMDAGFSLLDTNSAAADDMAVVNLYDCKMPATWTLGEIPLTASSIITVQNCDDGNDRSMTGRRDTFGKMLTNQSVYADNADQVESQTMSLEVQTEAKAITQTPFRFPIGKVHADFSTSKTITVELVHDALGSGTDDRFKNNEAWIEVHRPNSGDPGFLIETSGLADSFEAPNSGNAAGDDTWTGTSMTKEEEEKITLDTTTSGGEGWAEVFICFGVASIGAGDLFVSHDIGVS